MLRLGRTLGHVMAVLALAAPAVSQLPPGSPKPLAEGTGIIVGQVVDAATGKGVASAIVTLAGSRRVMSTADGRFAFRALPAGRHTLTASRSGYLDSAFGARRPQGPSLPVVLGDGERRADLVIWLWRHAAISGAIVDEAGEPVVGVQVTALRRAMQGGRRRFVMGGTATTDDRGIYRIGRLAPGDFVVGMATSQISMPASVARQYEEMMLAGGDLGRSALLQSIFQIGASPAMAGSTESRQVGDQIQSMGRASPTPPPVEGDRPLAYPSVYYPAAPSARAATLVSVTSGQERTGIDMQVRPVAMVKVSGTVIGASGPSSALPVRLTPQGSDDLGRTSDIAGTLSDASGAFTFPGVPSGDYTLKIVQTPRPTAPTSTPMTVQLGGGTLVMGTSIANPEIPTPSADPTMWATLPVAVGNSDITGLNVVLRRGVRVSGRVEFDGAAGQPPAAELARIPIVLESVEGPIERGAAPPARIDAKGLFATAGMPGGRYFVRVPVSPTGWAFKGAFLGDRDISDVPLELDANDITDVVLTFTDRPASLSGTVQMTERLARDGVAVIVFPADSRARMDAGGNPHRLRKVAATDAGAYDISPLPAGAYYVAAVPEPQAGDWQDPAFLEQLVNGAAHVQIDDGEKATQSLRVQEVR